MKFPPEVEKFMITLAQVLGLLLAILIFFEIWRLLTAVYGQMPERADIAIHILTSKHFLIGEVLLGMLIPFVRKSPKLPVGHLSGDNRRRSRGRATLSGRLKRRYGPSTTLRISGKGVCSPSISAMTRIPPPQFTGRLREPTTATRPFPRRGASGLHTSIRFPIWLCDSFDAARKIPKSSPQRTALRAAA